MGAKRSEAMRLAVDKIKEQQSKGVRYTTLDAAQEFGLVFQSIMMDPEYRAFRGLPPRKRGKQSE